HRNLPPLILSWALGALWITLGLVFADLNLVRRTTSSVALGLVPPDNYFRVGSAGFNTFLTTVPVAVLAISLTNLPRRAMAVGANRDSATYAGIRTRNTYLLCYSLSGALAASGGVFWALLSTSGQTAELAGRELTAIAVAILGGTVMSGGYL